jgi:hypothetical protein
MIAFFITNDFHEGFVHDRKLLIVLVYNFVQMAIMVKKALVDSFDLTQLHAIYHFICIIVHLANINQ